MDGLPEYPPFSSAFVHERSHTKTDFCARIYHPAVLSFPPDSSKG